MCPQVCSWYMRCCQSFKLLSWLHIIQPFSFLLEPGRSAARWVLHLLYMSNAVLVTGLLSVCVTARIGLCIAPLVPSGAVTQSRQQSLIAIQIGVDAISCDCYWTSYVRQWSFSSRADLTFWSHLPDLCGCVASGASLFAVLKVAVLVANLSMLPDYFSSSEHTNDPLISSEVPSIPCRLQACGRLSRRFTDAICCLASRALLDQIVPCRSRL